MPLSLKPEHLKRYADIVRLLMQHGRSDRVKGIDVDLPDDQPREEAVAGDPEKLARDRRPVAVKVQRPNIRQIILEDLEAFAQIAEMADKHTEIGRRLAFQPMLEEFRKTLMRELDYRREAVNLVTLANNLKDYPRLV